MATISAKAWKNYIAILRRVSDRASNEMTAYIRTQSNLVSMGELTTGQMTSNVIDYAYALATRYGEAAGAAACDMYDAIAALQGANVAPAVPASTATYDETAKAVMGTMKTGNYNIVADATGRLVKMVGVDTMLDNAERDGAEFAWIPQGETCAFCLTLASRGWQPISKVARRNGHAEHIHANCDCTYAVRFNPDLNVEGYDPQKWLDWYESQEGTPKDKINAMRREFYAENKELINEQKRAAYSLRKDMEEGMA